VLVDGNGIPLSVVLTGANVHDVKMIKEVLDSIVTDRPTWTGVPTENLCADKGYFGEPALEVIVLRGYIPHVVARGEEKKQLTLTHGKKARRYVVERVFSWFNRFRKLLVRYEKKASSYYALLEFACAFVAFRQVKII
jgi:transposase